MDKIIYAEPVSEKIKISLLEKKIEELIKKNEKLESDNERIINSISNFAPYIGDDYQWICIDKVCLTAKEPKMNDNPFSGESFSYHDMKKRMITQNYWGCYVSEDLKCYYTPAKYKYILASLVPVPVNFSESMSNDEKSVFYIRIPKIDMKTNKDGFGLLRRFKNEQKLYHGQVYIHGHVDCNGNIVYCHENGRGKFIVRKDRLRNYGYDLSWEPPNSKTKVFPNLSMCDNIQYDAEYYCTNCKCIDEGSCSQGTWKLYQCMGH